MNAVLAILAVSHSMFTRARAPLGTTAIILRRAAHSCATLRRAERRGAAQRCVAGMDEA